MAIDSSSTIRRGLDQASGSLQKSLTSLASGKRINSASSDPAGLAIAMELASTVSLSNQASRNVSDAVSASAIADGAASQLTDLGGRMAELATQAANGTLSNDQRSVINNEFQALSQEAQRIVETTQFNGINLLKGDSVSVQAGTNSSAASTISMPGIDGKGMVAGLASLSIATQGGARAAIDSVSSLIGSISAGRGEQGAVQRRLDSATQSLSDKSINASAARSRIEDADVAAESANVTASSTRQQVAATLLNRYQSSSVESSIVSGGRRKG